MIASQKSLTVVAEVSWEYTRQRARVDSPLAILPRYPRAGEERSKCVDCGKYVAKIGTPRCPSCASKARRFEGRHGR